jgi:hypothetical protein
MLDFDIPKPKVEFYTMIPPLTEDLEPRSGRADMISTLKRVKVPNFKETSIKNCPGIIQYGMQGFVLRAWQDILVEATADGVAARWETPLLMEHVVDPRVTQPSLRAAEEVVFMKQNAFYDHFPRDNTLKMVMKINTPWFVKLPRGYSALILPVWYDNEQRFETIPGILDTDYFEKINVQLYWRALGRTEIIQAGTPLCKILPIQLEDWDSEIRCINATDLRKYDLYSVHHNNKFAKPWAFFRNFMDKIRG